jgi:hypothetical protein
MILQIAFGVVIAWLIIAAIVMIFHYISGT